MKGVDDFVAVLCELFKYREVPLHEPTFGDTEIQAVSECIQSGYVSSIGECVRKFEEKLAQITGSSHVVAVTNGTTGLQLAGLIAGIEPDQEVLMPALSFVATANAFKTIGAIPHFVDIGLSNLGIDPDFLREYLLRIADYSQRRGLVNRLTGRKIVAIVPVHTFGHPCDVVQLKSLADELDLKVIEDAAEGLGSFTSGQHVGTIGDVGILSFNGNKILTTGGGGALLIQDELLAHRARHLSTTAKVAGHAWDYVHDEVGYNWRMPNLNAALGLAQLERLPQFVQSKNKLFEIYRDAFSGLSDVSIYSPKLRENDSSNYWLQSAIIHGANEGKILNILESCVANSIACRRPWTLTCNLLPYVDCQKSEIKTANLVRQTFINLPSSPSLGLVQ